MCRRACHRHTGGWWYLALCGLDGDHDAGDIKAAFAEPHCPCVPIDPTTLKSKVLLWRGAAKLGSDILHARIQALETAGMVSASDNLALIVWAGEARVIHWSRKPDATPGDGQLCRVDRDFVCFPLNLPDRDTALRNYGRADL